MPPVAVVTDTTQYLPAEVIARHGIHLVALYVNWNGRTDRESDLPDYDAYYDFLRSGGELPSTSQPSIGDFLAVYEPLLADGRDVLSIHLSGGISGTVRVAEQARDALTEQGVDPARIAVVDSLTGCAGHGFMAVAAANASQPSSRRCSRWATSRSNARPDVRTRSRGCISPSIVRIGLTFSVAPIHARAAPIRPPRRRNSSVSTAIRM